MRPYLFALLLEDTDWKKELLNRLDAVAAKLGTTSAYLWHVLVKQGYVEGVSDLVLAAIFLGIALYGIKFRKQANAIPKNEYKEWPQEKVGLFILSMIMSILGGALCVGNFYYGLQELLNPEFYALMKVFEAVK